MFCYQCEQTAKGQGCSQIGVCGKDDNTATLQDLLVHALKGVSMFAHRAAKLGVRDASIDEFVVEALFATLTNVNFDPVRVAALIEQTAKTRDRARELYLGAAAAKGLQPEQFNGASKFKPEASLDGLISQGKTSQHPRGQREQRQRSRQPAGVNPLRHQGSCGLRRARPPGRRHRCRNPRHHSRGSRFPHPPRALARRVCWATRSRSAS